MIFRERDSTSCCCFACDSCCVCKGARAIEDHCHVFSPQTYFMRYTFGSKSTHVIRSICGTLFILWFVIAVLLLYFEIFVYFSIFTILLIAGVFAFILFLVIVIFVLVLLIIFSIPIIICCCLTCLFCACLDCLGLVEFRPKINFNINSTN